MKTSLFLALSGVRGNFRKLACISQKGLRKFRERGEVLGPLRLQKWTGFVLACDINCKVR
jgi:hypothetical protein